MAISSLTSTPTSLSKGILLIIWPAAGEQALNAAFFSAEPNPVAIELFQVHTGQQIGLSLHTDAKITGTLEDASKEFKATFAAVREARDGVLRTNAEKMASTLREAHAGEASDEIVRLARF
ncbi:hypothetical protein MVEN_00201300 [Mycena venus]|uniref:Uncharacterized protein n=1 Tax=Mycena venus TaxID=2733690 RepID=A0A8H6Z0U8_9AGAR|nr:hypothetical protein MVEN_00201300 [Mycena venus]